MRKAIKFIALLVSLAFLAVDIAGVVLLYRAYKDRKAPEQAAAMSTALYAAADKNPYEDPDDPNTTEKGTLFTTETMTGYFMELDLAGVRCDTGISLSLSGYPPYVYAFTNNFSKKTSSVTALLTFADVTYNDLPVFVSAVTNITADRWAFKMGAKFTFNDNFRVENDTALRIPASYYNYLKREQENGKDLSQIRVILTWDGNKSQDTVGTYSVPCRLVTTDIPADSDDPESPNFKLDNWAGIMATVESKTGCPNFWRNTKIVLIVIGCAFGFALLVWALRKFFHLLGFGGK